MTDTAAVRGTIANDRFEQRVVRFAPGRSAEETVGDKHDVLYVVSGRGTLLIDGRAHELEPETAAYLAPGDSYSVENPGPEDLVVVAVSAPAELEPQATPDRRTVRYADQPALPASPNREFRYLVNEDIGCPEITQFVGVIPPGKAGMHSHTYDEVVYVLEGEGVLHMHGETTPLRPGTCIHLPPLEEHCLENTRGEPMRVLGVFHPSGDPASRHREEAVGNN